MPGRTQSTRLRPVSLLHSVLSLALAFVVGLSLVEPAAAHHEQFPSGLAVQWCGSRGGDFSPGWFRPDRPQIKVVFAYAADQTSWQPSMLDRIQQDVKAMVDKVGHESGGRRSIAFDLGTECGPRYVDMAIVRLNSDSSTYRAMDIRSRSQQIQGELRTSLGLGPGDTLGGQKRNYAVYVYLGPPVTLNQAYEARGDMPGCPDGGSASSCQPDHRPGPENIANSGGYWAWVFNVPGPRFTMLHEITHTLGAVQDVAAHSTFKLYGAAGRGHCTDGPDVMCPSAGDEPCYDCNYDDYFELDPPWDLTTQWNVANSVFMCDFSSPEGCAPPPIFAATSNNALWARGLALSDVNWNPAGHANDVVAMAATGGKLFAATRDNKLWARDPVLDNVNWQHIGHANDVVAMAATGGKLFAATRSNHLWVRDPVLFDVNWQYIGHARDVVAMTASGGKLFAADRYNELWARDPVLYDVNWQDIGHANDVVAMTAAGGKLFAATSDNRLWARDPLLYDVNWTPIGHAINVVAMAAEPQEERIRMPGSQVPLPPEEADPEVCTSKYYNPPEECGPR
jgi:hypothetical protein